MCHSRRLEVRGQFFRYQFSLSTLSEAGSFFCCTVFMNFEPILLSPPPFLLQKYRNYRYMPPHPGIKFRLSGLYHKCFLSTEPSPNPFLKFSM